jgi:hypothetical protein
MNWNDIPVHTSIQQHPENRRNLLEQTDQSSPTLLTDASRYLTQLCPSTCHLFQSFIELRDIQRGVSPVRSPIGLSVSLISGASFGNAT